MILYDSISGLNPKKGIHEQSKGVKKEGKDRKEKKRQIAN